MEDGTAYVGGDFSDSITFGTTTLIADGERLDAFLAKYDPAGKVVWAVRAGGPVNEWGNALAALPDGTVAEDSVSPIVDPRLPYEPGLGVGPAELESGRRAGR